MMIRYLMAFLFLFTLIFFFLEGQLSQTFTEKPLFTRYDTLAAEHHPFVNFFLDSRYKPTDMELEGLRKDYSNIWAHLNCLYSTGDVVEGKEYYTEAWFKNLCRNYHGKIETGWVRKDPEHHVHLINWDWDGLVCHLVDSNAVWVYYRSPHDEAYPKPPIKITKVNLALVLLLQGDHWRIDGIKILNENTYYLNPTHP